MQVETQPGAGRPLAQQHAALVFCTIRQAIRRQDGARLSTDHCIGGSQPCPSLVQQPIQVDKEELDGCYREADAFVCLSEPEGFGLPIFEAMRSNLPTVALKQTAIAELIGTHPLAFSEFTGSRFAAAIATLQEGDIRSYVLRYQDENILPQYPHRVVVSQIRQGLAALFPACDAGSLAVPLPRPYRDVILDREINERVQKLTEQAAGYSSRFLTDIRRETPNDFMTRYDLEAYQELTSTIPIESDGPGGIADTGSDGDGQQRRRSGILIPASRFSTMEGPIWDNVFTISLSVGYEHLIYGPHVAIPKGIYSIDFQVELLDVSSETSTSALHFDVADSRNQLCQGIVSLAELQTGVRPILEFFQGKDDALIEFRVSGDRCEDGAVHFRGVVLRKLASTTYLFDQVPTDEFPKSPEIITLRKRIRREIGEIGRRRPACMERGCSWIRIISRCGCSTVIA